MKSKHTPGPWHFHKKQSEFAFRIDAAGDDWQELATVYQVPPYTHLMEQGEANARLIAAAPELLEALTRMREMYQVLLEQTGGRDDSILFDARRAIAKATGGAE